MKGSPNLDRVGAGPRLVRPVGESRKSLAVALVMDKLAMAAGRMPVAGMAAADMVIAGTAQLGLANLHIAEECLTARTVDMEHKAARSSCLSNGSLELVARSLVVGSSPCLDRCACALAVEWSG